MKDEGSGDSSDTFTQHQLLTACDHYLPLVCEQISNVDPKQCNRGELIAFTAYATAFPNTFLALIDTYNVLKLDFVIECYF